MIDYTTILKSDIPLVEATIDYFTSESCNPHTFEEIKEIGIKWGKHFKKANAETFINLGYLSVFDFTMYLSEKKLIGNGINTTVVDLTTKALEEKLIISSINPMLASNTENRYKSNGEYTKHLYENDLIFNLILGFNYIIAKYQNSVVKIDNIDKNKDSSIGTGFLIQDSNSQLIITNRHVIEKSVKLNLFDKKDTPIEFEEPFLDKERDLAIIPVKVQLNIPVFQLNSSVEVLSEIITIGYPSIPMTKLAYQVCHKGEVNSFVEDYHNNKLFLISAKTSSGNSGSPVIDKTGLVIGIITKELFEKDLFEKKGKLPYYAAIPTEEIIQTINEYKKVANRGG